MTDEPQTISTKNAVKEIEVKGYKFSIDTDLLDDVESLDFLERIENKGQVAAVLPLLRHIMGAESFEKLKAYFVEADRKENEGKDGYKPRMRIQDLNDTYIAIIEKFDPKG